MYQFSPTETLQFSTFLGCWCCQTERSRNWTPPTVCWRTRSRCFIAWQKMRESSEEWTGGCYNIKTPSYRDFHFKKWIVVGLCYLYDETPFFSITGLRSLYWNEAYIHFMMTSWERPQHSGPLSGESTGRWYILLTKGQWCFICCQPE